MAVALVILIASLPEEFITCNASEERKVLWLVGPRPNIPPTNICSLSIAANSHFPSLSFHCLSVVPLDGTCIILQHPLLCHLVRVALPVGVALLVGVVGPQQ